MSDSTSDTANSEHDDTERLLARTERRIDAMHLRGRVRTLSRQFDHVTTIKAALADEQIQLDAQLADLVGRDLTPTDLSRIIDLSHTSITKAVERHRARSAITESSNHD